MLDLVNLDDRLKEWGEMVIGKIRRNMEATGTNASGRSSASLEVVITDTGLEIVGRRWFQGVEQGRPGGKIPYKFNEIIRQWMDDKHIADNFGKTEAEKRTAAWHISQFIKEHGTKLHRDGGRDDIFTAVFDEEVPKLEAEIKSEVEKMIVTRINNAATEK